MAKTKWRKYGLKSSNSGDGTVGKALEVLDMVASFERPIRFSELLEASPYPKATLYRLVQTLTNQRMLSYDPESQYYRLGIRLVKLAHVAWASSSIAPVVRPHIDALSRDLGEVVHLAQLDNAQVLYIDKRNAGETIPMYSQAGKVGPAYCTGVGKTMMAFLPKDELDEIVSQQSFHRFTPKTLADAESLKAELQAIRDRGYGFDDEEHEPEIICVALPLLSSSGRVLGGISVTSTTNKTDLNGLASFVPRMREAARDIQEEVQNWRFPDQTFTK
ncbi:IclR family transcriptional regulator [Halocynthiibacter sp. C4]|uniref:IclR family transcriptional regulator n=1 Tax=Halocynthiibacter sp. C4 TaxID=2992758 RepID=UPI00237B500C|nr:IclR family transcriptional regulator [Halocynthiibacter sp. C4]MDE0588601.1 IclR family transcriptional regulator [Halocynthiibacter sp. C4]